MLGEAGGHLSIYGRSSKSQPKRITSGGKRGHGFAVYLRSSCAATTPDIIVSIEPRATSVHLTFVKSAGRWLDEDVVTEKWVSSTKGGEVVACGQLASLP